MATKIISEFPLRLQERMPASTAASLQPSWAHSPASPAVAVLEERAKAWSLAQRFGSSVDIQEGESLEPLPKRQRRH